MDQFWFRTAFLLLPKLKFCMYMYGSLPSPLKRPGAPPAPHMGLTSSHVGNSQTYLYLSSKQEVELKRSLLLMLCFCLNVVYIL